MPRDSDSPIAAYAEVIPGMIREGLIRHGGRWFRVVSPSMYPLIGIGDWVWIESCDAESATCGDIVAFIRDGRICIHRVIRVLSSTAEVVEKGDWSKDVRRVPTDHVVGFVHKIRKGTRVIRLDAFRFLVLDRMLTLRSILHAWLKGNDEGVADRILARLPHGLEGPVQRMATRFRSVLFWFYRMPLFGAPSWAQRSEVIRVGGKELLVHIVPAHTNMEAWLRQARGHLQESGILFVFDATDAPPFDQAVIKVPRSVGLFDKDGVLTEVRRIRPPEASPHGMRPAAFALEVGLDWFSRSGIEPGAKLHAEGFWESI